MITTAVSIGVNVAMASVEERVRVGHLNAEAAAPCAPIEAFPNAMGNLPIMFPATRGAVVNLGGPAYSNLLAHGQQTANKRYRNC